MIDISSKELALASMNIFFERSFENYELEKVLNTNSGLYGGTYRKIDRESPLNDVAIIAFRGSKHLDDYVTNLGLILSMRTSNLENKMKRANEYVDEEINRLRSENCSIQIYVTGHSLGGVYAQDAAIHHHLHGASFNSPGLPRNLQTDPEATKQEHIRFYNHRIGNDVTSRLHQCAAVGDTVVHQPRYGETEIGKNHCMIHFIEDHFANGCGETHDSCYYKGPSTEQIELNRIRDQRWICLKRLGDWVIHSFSMKRIEAEPTVY